MFKSIPLTGLPNAARTIGDVNGDGLADVLSPSADGTIVDVFLGNGDGTFRQGGSFAPAGGVSKVVLGDVNGDGKLDVGITSSAGNSVTVALGNGDGTFYGQGHYIGTSSDSFVLADLNGDGRADLITSSAGDAISVRLEQGNGQFGPASLFVPATHTGQTATYSVAVADLNGDGRRDLVAYDRATGALYAMAGLGNGQFQAASQIGSFAPRPQTTIQTTDINDDGRVDIYVSFYKSQYDPYDRPESSFLISRADGTYGSASSYIANYFDGRIGYNIDVSFGDLNGDGRTDVFRADSTALISTKITSAPYVQFYIEGDNSLKYSIRDLTGIENYRLLRSNDSGSFDVVQQSALGSYVPQPGDGGHVFRVAADTLDLNYNFTPVTGDILLGGSFATDGPAVTVTTAPFDDLISGTLRTGGVSNVAIYTESVRLENTIRFDYPPNATTGITNIRFTVDGPQGHDTLIRIQDLRFLDGELTYSPADAPAIVQRLYQGAFGRDPDMGGHSHFTALLEHGVSVRDVATSLTSSAEFQSGNGASSNADFTQSLYQHLLHRAADVNEVAYWSGQLDGGLTRADVLAGIAQSSEALGISQTAINAAGGLFVVYEHAAELARLYDTAFGRDPDRAGLEVWRGFLDQGGQGHGLQDVANAFAASPEFQARYGQASNSDYVDALYQNTLDRAPDTQGQAHWVAILNSGAETRAQVALDFSESPEHQNLLAPHIQQGLHLV